MGYFRALRLLTMRELNLWKFILKRIEAQTPLALLVVLDSEGSSPGRQGFKMAVTESELCGSVGGGMMEYKFVELAREKLNSDEQSSLLKKQVHNKAAKLNQSGMICSGEQTIFISYLSLEVAPIVNRIIASLTKNENGTLAITANEISFDEKVPGADFYFSHSGENDFVFKEKLGYKNYLHIIGGGHCSYALSMLMKDLDFHITVYDDRKELNTFTENIFAHQKIHLSDYSEIKGKILSGENVYVVIMTFSHRTDNITFRAIVENNYKYLGVLGSRTKISQMKTEWRGDGIEESRLRNIYSPVGLPIKSQTPSEIAISIAAEIISVKNSKFSIP